MAGFFDSAESFQSNNSGLLAEDKLGLSKFGAKYLPEYASILRQQAATPFQMPTGQLALNQRGLTSEQENAVSSPFAEAINQMFSKVSGQTAQRGFLNPANTSAVAGSAAQNVAPQFANLFASMATNNVNQNLERQWQLPQIVEQMRQAKEQQAMGLFSQIPGFLGSSGGGMSTGPGFGQGLTTSLIEAAGRAGGAKNLFS